MRNWFVTMLSVIAVMVMLALLFASKQASAATPGYWSPWIDPDERCTLGAVRWEAKAYDRSFRCAMKCMRREARGRTEGTCDLTDAAGMDPRMRNCMDKVLEKLLAIPERMECEQVEIDEGIDVQALLTEVFNEGKALAQGEIDELSANIGGDKCKQLAVVKAGTLCRQSHRCVLGCMRMTYGKRHYDGLRHEPDGPCRVLEPGLDSNTDECMARVEQKYRRAVGRGPCMSEVFAPTVEDIIDQNRELLQEQIELLTMGVMNEPAP